MEIDCSTREKWFRHFSLDGDGIPTSALSADELSSRLGAHPELIASMCRSLEFTDLVIEEPKYSRHYCYNLHTGNLDLQVKVEVALVDFAALSAQLKLPPVPPGFVDQFGNRRG